MNESGIFLPGEAVQKKMEKEEALKLKEAGNEATSRKDWTAALDYYTKAMACPDTELLAVVLNNRSLVFWHLGDVTQSLEDSERARELDPLWYKPLVCFKFL